MNRAELIAALAAFETAAAVFREELESQARHELDANGVKVDWKMPEATVWASVTQGAVSVHDEAAFLKWMKLRHPDQVETVQRVRPAFQKMFLRGAAQRGGPPHASDGEVIPGLTYLPGGAFKSVSLRVSDEVKERLAAKAREMVEGRRPLALPVVEAGERNADIAAFEAIRDHVIGTDEGVVGDG